MRTRLKQNEKVILITRLHWYPTIFFQIFCAVFCFAVGIIVGTQVAIFYFISLIAFAFATYKIIDRQKNIWVVTNLRVIDENGVFTHFAKESPLDKINNVSYSQSFWGRQIGYGNVIIQTAAGQGTTMYFGVKNPRQLKDAITTMQEEYKRSANKEQAKELAGIFANGQQNKTNISNTTELEKIFELKQKGVLTEGEYNNLKTKILNT